ncbi:MAG: hypothetical protein U7126_20675 [Microcoleus sp.]
MDTAHILQFVDEVVCAKTGKHLNDLQRKIIKGILKQQKYSDIADTYGCTAGHAKDVGYKLLQMLSDVFDEPVDKYNLKSVLERQLNLNINFGDRILLILVIAIQLTISMVAQNYPLLPQIKLGLKLLTSRTAQIKLRLKWLVNYDSWD